jgi:membrane associated rhomboid family serine protease
VIPVGSSVATRYPPLVTWALIATNCAVFFYQQTLSVSELNQFIDQFGLIPERLTDSIAHGDDAAANLLPLITLMFLHGGWLHLIFNMWTLWLFGPTIEDRLGHERYVVFYFGCGVAASLTQVAFDPNSTAPMIGASGAIAGVLGSYTVLFPFSRVIVLVPIFVFPFFFELPAVVVIGFWFLAQVFQGTAELLTSSNGGVASWAHVGGFVVGLCLIPFIKQPRRRYRDYYADEGILGFNPQGAR